MGSKVAGASFKDAWTRDRIYLVPAKYIEAVPNRSS